MQLQSFWVILGIFVSYNEKLVKQHNFDRVLHEFKVVLNLWKTRSLTIYGRSEILKSLAIPKLLFVCNMLIPTSDFVKEVKNIITSFIWSARRPKVKYHVLVKPKEEGGINLPDLETRVTTQQILWVKRILAAILSLFRAMQ